MYYQSHEDSILQRAWGLDLISLASQGCPQRADRPPKSSSFQPQDGYYPGWSAANVSCLLSLLHFPGSLGERAPVSWWAWFLSSSYPLLTLSNFLTRESQLLFSSRFTGWQSGVQDRTGRDEEMKEPSGFGGFAGEKKILFLSIHLQFFGWGLLIKW